MADIGMKTGRTEMLVESALKLNTQAQSVEDAPGGLFPLQTKSFSIEEYRMMAGWPVPVPPYDIRAQTLISGEGESFSVRDDNTAITTGALIRWVADSEYYDEVALQWTPITDNTGGQNVWNTSVEYAPVLIDDYTYRVRNEVFTENCLNFDSDTRNHMWADFTSTIGGSMGYTVIMVMSPNSAFGNENLPYNGLWCPGGATPEGDTFSEPVDSAWASVTMQASHLWYQTDQVERQAVISMSQQVLSNAPMYLAFVIAPLESVFYVGFGPENIQFRKVATGTEIAALNDHIVLGRSNGDVLHTADMALFDLGIYADYLSATQVRDEFAILSRSYGGSD